MTNLADVVKWVEDLKTYPDYQPEASSDGMNLPTCDCPSCAFARGAQAALDSVLSHLRSRIEHDRGRG